jgi:hypothetical protein
MKERLTIALDVIVVHGRIVKRSLQFPVGNLMVTKRKKHVTVAGLLLRVEHRY